VPRRRPAQSKHTLNNRVGQSTRPRHGALPLLAVGSKQASWTRTRHREWQGTKPRELFTTAFETLSAHRHAPAHNDSQKPTPTTTAAAEASTLRPKQGEGTQSPTDCRRGDETLALPSERLVSNALLCSSLYIESKVHGSASSNTTQNLQLQHIFDPSTPHLTCWGNAYQRLESAHRTERRQPTQSLWITVLKTRPVSSLERLRLFLECLWDAVVARVLLPEAREVRL
jgi:hypothetical protein